MNKIDLIKKLIDLNILNEKEMVSIPPSPNKRFKFKKGDKIIYEFGSSGPCEGEIVHYDPGNIVANRRVSFFTNDQLKMKKDNPNEIIEPKFEYSWRVKLVDEFLAEYETRPRIYIKKDDYNLIKLSNLIGSHIPVICPTKEGELFKTILTDINTYISDDLDSYHKYTISNIITFDYGFLYILSYRKKHFIFPTQFVFYGGLLKPIIYKLSNKEYEEICKCVQ